MMLFSLGRVILGVESSLYVICTSALPVARSLRLDLSRARLRILNLFYKHRSFLRTIKSCSIHFLTSLLIIWELTKRNWIKGTHFYASYAKRLLAGSPGIFGWVESGHFSKGVEFACLPLTRNDRGMLLLLFWTVSCKWQTITRAAF